MTSTVSISESVISKFIKHKQLRWEDFTNPDRFASVSREIEKYYKQGKGIQASDVCRILFIYNQSRKYYEGICYHLFNMVATKDGHGHIYFVKVSDIGNTEFPVIPSRWHNLDKVVRDSLEEDSSSSSAISSSNLDATVSSLEKQFNSSSSVGLPVSNRVSVSSAVMSLARALMSLSEALNV